MQSPLFFGNALDAAFSRLLIDKKKELLPEELEQLSKTPEQIFYEKMLQTEHNYKTVSLPQNENCDYYASDFTPELLTKDAIKLLEAFAPDIEDYTEFHTDCVAYFKSKQKLQKKDQILFNYLTWLSLVEKGYLMVEAYRTEIMPQIEEVFNIQKRISITNEYGDSISGLIDFIASFVDQPGTKYICDNKSSSTKYDDDSVIESAQLATYCEAENIQNAAYIVIVKKVYKRSPFIHTQVIRNTIPERTFVKTFDEFEEIVYSITEQKFPKNEKSCFAFGRRCEYYQLCKFGKSQGLYKNGTPKVEPKPEKL